MTASDTLSADTLLRHEPFVRAVVRALVADEARVQDVVQETWLTALRRPPRAAGSLRAWLGRVAGNLARDAQRGTARRRAREAAVARSVSVEPVEATHGRLAAQREVVDAVLALREPYRSVVRLRTWQGLERARSPPGWGGARGRCARSSAARRSSGAPGAQVPTGLSCRRTSRGLSEQQERSGLTQQARARAWRHGR